MNVTIELPADWEAGLQRVARRQGKDIQDVLRDGIRLQLRQDILSESESRLLEIINAPLPLEARLRRDELRSVQAERALTDEERASLIEAVDAVELANARRWEAIASLAEQRGQSLAEIAQELEIPLLPLSQRLSFGSICD